MSLDVPIVFAFSAGIVAAFNPCGAAMLPAYIGYQMSGLSDTEDPLIIVGNGIFLGLMVTAGFITFSLLAGIIITIGGDYIFKIFPFAGLAVGISITALGFWLMLTGSHFTILVATRFGIGEKRGPLGVFLFGIVYAVSSLGCAFPIFLAAVGILSGHNIGNVAFVESLIRFVSYGLGMGLVLTTVTLGVVFFRDLVSKTIRKIIPYVGLAGNLFLVFSGLYLTWYWIFGHGSELLYFNIDKIF